MWLKQFFLSIFNEMRLEFYLTYYYKGNLLLSLAAMCIRFIGYSFFIFHGKIASDLLFSPFLGYIVWFYVFFILSDMSSRIHTEIQVGTIEQLFMGIVSPCFIFISRLCATIILATIKLLIVLCALSLFISIPMTFSWSGVLVLLLTLMGVCGLGLAIAGITLAMKRTEILGMLLAIFLFFGGTIVPVNNLPTMIQKLSIILPTTQGIIVLRNILIDGQPLSTLWGNGSLILVCLIACLYLFLGVYIFEQCIKSVQRKGTLSHY